MTELTPRQILDAIDRTLEEIAAVRDGWVEADFELGSSGDRVLD